MRSVQQGANAPLAYAHLSGAFGLVASDNAWSCLSADVELGMTFVSSAVVPAYASVDCFLDCRGVHAHICRSGVSMLMVNSFVGLEMTDFLCLLAGT